LERVEGDPEMAGPSPIVVDASVAVKWFNPEEHSEQAL